MEYRPEARMRLLRQIRLNILEHSKVQDGVLANRIAHEWIMAACRRKDHAMET